MIIAQAFPLPSKRAEAIALGTNRFFTGKPCKRGHVAPRLRSSGTCVLCHNKTVSNWQKNNQQACRIRQTKYRHKKLGIPSAPRIAPSGCELCGRVFHPASTANLDHDHATGAFRGWLCRRCNVSIGGLGDNVAGLERAIAYLKRSS